MTENTTESYGAELYDAPEDRATEDGAKGYAVYDRRLGRYVSGVTTDKPSAKDSREAAGHGDTAVVRV